jgi:hypothetical protein
MYKRLERGTFERLALPDDAARVEIDRARLHMLLEGVTLKSLRFRRNFTPRVSISARREHDAAAAR